MNKLGSIFCRKPCEDFSHLRVSAQSRGTHYLSLRLHEHSATSLTSPAPPLLSPYHTIRQSHLLTYPTTQTTLQLPHKHVPGRINPPGPRPRAPPPLFHPPTMPHPKHNNRHPLLLRHPRPPRRQRLLPAAHHANRSGPPSNDLRTARPPARIQEGKAQQFCAQNKPSK